MYNKLFLFLTLSTLLILPVSAETTESSGAMMVPEKMMPPIVDPGNPLLIPIFGEDHAYTVTLRGNGEAVIDMRVALSNFEEEPKNEVVLKYTGETAPTDVAVFQIIKEKQCIEYDRRAVIFGSPYSESDLPCIRYQDPNYYDYWGVNQKYYKAEVSVKDNQIYITLPKPIEPEKSGSYVLFMRTRGVTQKVFGGAYAYHVETMKTVSPIRNLQIGILSDSDMKFKDADAQVYYGSTTNSAMMMDMASKRASFQSTDFDNYVSQIGQGQIYKSSNNLSPGDTYTVDGMYAKSMVSLYLKEALSIFGLIVLTFVIIIGVVIGVAKLRSHRPQNPQKPTSHMKALILVLTAGFLSGLCIAGYTLILVAASKYMESWYGFTNMFSILMLAIFSCGVYSIFIFGPTVIAWLKRGWKWGVLMFGVTMLWVVMFLVIIGVYYLARGIFPTNSHYEDSSMYMEKTVPVMRGETVPPPPGIDEVSTLEVEK